MKKIIKKNYLVIGMLFLFTYSNAKGKGGQNHLVEMYSKIYNTSIKLGTIEEGSIMQMAYSDSLEKENGLFIDTFLSILTKDGSFSMSFKQLAKDIPVSVIISSDKKIRFFSWNTYLGGTMDQYAVIVQYLDKLGKAHAKLVNSAGLFYGTEKFAKGFNALYTNIYTVHGININYYLAKGNGKCDNMCLYNQINALSIDQDKVIFPENIICNNKSFNVLKFNYQINSIKDNIDYSIDVSKLRILEPIMGNGKNSVTYKLYYLKK